MNVYFISGLAADSRVFQNIELPEGYHKIYLDWITPKKDEGLPDYSLRLAEKINKQRPFILVGLSMGGMIATEIAKHFPPKATVLISSVSKSNQLPGWYKWMYQTRAYKLVPTSMLKSISVAKRVFSPEDNNAKKMLVKVIRDADTRFIRWAIEAILKWDNQYTPSPLYHIHGERDGIIPIKKLHPTHIIKRGTHLMVISRTEELNAFFEEVLRNEAV